jgi:hypothetical protein
MSTIPAELTKRFHHTAVRKNPKGQDYVAIDGYINRLNDVVGINWDWHVDKFELRDAPPTSSGKPQYLAIVTGWLQIAFPKPDGLDDAYWTYTGSSRRNGIGAGLNFDPDTAVKTAQAEALKKACHQFGIALYLWSEEERDFVQMQRAAANDDVGLKRLVMEYTIRQQGLDPYEQPSREDIMKCLGTEDLSVENMRSILVERGEL